MIDTDLISVLIPAYNHEKYVGATLDSLVGQTYENIELIIINDGSTDNTDQIIQNNRQKCEKRFTRFKHITKKNEGIIKTLNKGLSLAKGKYIYIIASDDSAEPEAIELLHNFLSENNDYGLAVGDSYIMDDVGQRCYWNENYENVYNESEAKFLTVGQNIRDHRIDVDFNSDEFGTYTSLLLENYIPNGYLIRKDIFDEIGGYSEAATLEDYYIMLQIAKLSKMKFIDEPLFNYRWHSSNTMKQIEKQKNVTIETLLLEEKYAKENGYENDFIRALGYKKRSGIPYLFETLKKGGAFKERISFRILGIGGVVSITNFLDKKIIKIIGIPVYKKKLR